MLRLIIFILGVLLMLAGTKIGELKEAHSTAMLGTPDGYAVNCAAGFTRVLPHYCINNFSVSTPAQSAVLDGVCRTLDWSAFLPASAKRVHLGVLTSLVSVNGIAQRSASFGTMQIANCSIADEIAQNNGREFAAVAAGTTIYVFQNFIEGAIINQATVYTGTKSAGANPSTIAVSVYGYYD